ncbi:MAG TPA: signal peptide peptidase SppA [Planctomycetota bacterium]|nr:signal peptide peptidase SppA [Planctomycetota bacterium]
MLAHFRLRRSLVAVALVLAAVAAHPDRASAVEGESSDIEKVVRLTIRGQVRDADGAPALFGGAAGVHLRDIVAGIRAAAADPETWGVVIRIQSPNVGWTQAQAIRRALLEFRASGKPSFCHLRTGSIAEYLIGSACSEVSILPSGVLEIPGVSAGSLYLGDLLSKLGIRMQELRMGRYKSAAESLVRNGPSDASREQIEAILDDRFDELVDAIAENRKLINASVRALIDKGLFLPEEALEAKLVDRIEFEDELVARVTHAVGGARPLVEARFGKEALKIGTGMAGFMTLVNQLFSGPSQKETASEPRIAVIEGVGAIVTGSATGDVFGGAVMASDAIVSAFREARADDSVRAIVFRVNSPGGSAIASDLIWRAVKETSREKPVVVSMGDYAASGGYYVSCAANWIVAEPGTLTGSIGVIGVLPDLSELFEKVGIRATFFHRGRRAGAIDPTGRLTDDGKEMLDRYMRSIYDVFLSRVAEGRKLPVDAVAAIAEGRVWTGKRAKELGLVDELGGVEKALEHARKLAKLPEGCDLLILPRPVTLFELLSRMDVSVGALPWRTLTASLPDVVRPVLRDLEWLRSAGEERVFLVAPTITISP